MRSYFITKQPILAKVFNTNYIISYRASKTGVSTNFALASTSEKQVWCQVSIETQENKIVNHQHQQGNILQSNINNNIVT